MEKRANILDWPKPSLEPAIFNEDNTLKPEVKEFILGFIHSFAKANNFKDTFSWITQVKFVGSLTTNMWNSNSDMDIHIEVDLPKFVEVEHPEMTEKEASDYLDEIRKQVDQVKAKVPQTQHPTEIYFETEFTTRASQAFLGTYSVLEDKWLTPPHIVEKDFDIATLHPDLLNLAKETAAELDAAFGEIKCEVQDIKELQETVNDWPPEQRELFEKKLQKKLDSLTKEIEELVVIREDVAEKRKHYDAVSEQEVRFKYLQKYFYMHVLTDLKTLLKQSPDLTIKDIPVVENIMHQANLNKFSNINTSYWVSPQGEEYPLDEETHMGWVELHESMLMDKGMHISDNVEDEMKSLFQLGWTRIIQEDLDSEYQFAIHVGNLDNIPSSADSFIANHFDPNRMIIVDDEQYRSVAVSDPFPSLQKAVDRASQQERMQQANLNKKAGFGEIQYWLDSMGKEYNVQDDSDNHTDWLIEHLDLFKNQYGLDKNFTIETDDDINKIYNWTAKNGWVRVGDTNEFDSAFSVVVQDMRRIPDFVNDFIAKHYESGVIEVEDGKNMVKISDPFPSIQKAVNKALSNPMKSANLKLAYQEDENRILVDMDDTICHEESDGECGEPMEGVREALNKLQEMGYEIVIFSARADNEHGEDEIRNYLESHEIPYDSIFQGEKPIARFQIDDRAIHFDNWNSVLKQIEKSDKTANLTVTVPYGPITGKKFTVFEDPTREQAGKLAENSHSRVLRWAIANNGHLYMWDAYYMDHPMARAALGAEWPLENSGYLLDGQGITQRLGQYWQEKEKHLVHSTLELPIIDPAILNRKEPYALFIGTQRYSEDVAVDLFDVFGEHPMITKSNAVPTVTLDTLIKENIPVIGKEPRAAGKEPIQDISGVVKTAQLGSEYDFSSTHFLLPKELAEKIIRWAVETIPEKEIVYDSKDPGTKGIQLESHITLKYGLLTDDFEEVKKALEGEKAPHLKFSKTSFFEPEGKDYDVVIIPVESEDLQKLNEKLCSQVEHEDLQFKEYHPHVTVAYVQRGKGKEFDGKDIITDEELELSELTFSPKNGEKRILELKGTTKESSFMPSNTDLAPSDDWAGTVGYPTNESMDAPQNKSDEETWYSPENDRPRNKNWFWNLLNMFKKQQPMSKKDIVPVKEAEVDKKTALDRMWIDPSGQVYYLEGDIHASWIVPNLEMLERDYGFKIPKRVWNQRANYYKLIEEQGDEDNLEIPDVWSIQEEMFKKGWIRIGDTAGTEGVGVELLNLRTIPAFLDNLLAKFLDDGEKVIVEDKSKNHVTVTYPFKSLQQAVNKALSSPTKTATVKEAHVNDAYWLAPDGKAFTVREEYTGGEDETHLDWISNNLKLLKNKYGIQFVENEDLENVANRMLSTGWVRIDNEPTQGLNIFLNNMRRVPSSLENFVVPFLNGKNSWFIEDQHGNDVKVTPPFPSLQKGINEALSHKRLTVSKQWTTSQEPVNQLGMSWGWADEIYNYVDENWQDLLLGWLDLDPKNYVKPVVLIEKIYEDEGGVSAWVHIEFVNTAGNTDAFMKLVISANIHGEVNIEPEGKEYFEHLTDWETEVLDYGKSDELEKSSSYGPTNYQGPSVADDNMYQDSPYNMNVTWSPEEDEELDDQNGAGGYPNRWFGRHRGPYYTNEGKVVKMLEETSALETLPEQQPITENTNAGTAVQMDDGSIYFSNESNLVHIKLIKQLGLPPEHIVSGGYIKDGIYHDSGPRSDTMRYVEMAMAQKRVDQKYKKHQTLGKKDIKADISGQVVNDILNLIHTNGGATYNLSKGNLVGTDAYAVAIYPDREQIISRPLEFNDVEQYLIDNQNLLANSNNSFGAWVSGDKVYLDIVATVKDLHEAMKLGLKHNQLAIFSLKTLQEIPIQRTASLKVAGNVLNIQGVNVYKNPSKEQVTALLKSAEYYVIRWVMDDLTGDFYVWDAADLTHDMVMGALGIIWDQEYNEKYTGELQQDSDVQRALNYISRTRSKLLKTVKQAAAVSDREQQEYYNDIYRDRWGESVDKINGGNEYYDYSELNGNDYPAAKDIDKERALLDQLENPATRNMPTGIGEYQITYYDAFPDQGDQSGM